MSKADNNTDPESFLKNGLSECRLPAEDKADIRQQLADHISADQSGIWLSAERLIPLGLNRMAVAVAAFLFLVGGVTYSAQTALPTDPLYGIKTNVNETFASLTSWSDSQAAETQSKLAARRLQELQTLVRKDGLTTTASQDLLSRISKHTKSARQKIAQLRTEGRNKQRQATRLESRLSALLAANSQALADVAERSGDVQTASTTRAAARRLLALAKSATSTEDTPPEASARTAVLDLLQVTTTQLSDTHKDYLRTNSSAASTTAKDGGQLPPELTAAAKTLQTAVDDIKNNDYSQAVTRLEAVLAKTDTLRRRLTDKSVADKESRPSTSTAKEAAITHLTSSGTTTEMSATKQVTSSRSKNATTTPASRAMGETAFETFASTSSSTPASLNTNATTTPASDTSSAIKQTKEGKIIQTALQVARKLLANTQSDNNTAASSTTASMNTPKVKSATSSQATTSAQKSEQPADTSTSSSENLTDEQAM